MSTYIDEFPDPKPCVKADFDEFRRVCDDDEGWDTLLEGEVTVLSKAVEGQPINCIKVRYTLTGVEADVFYDTLHDPDYRKTWDDNMAAGYCIEQLDNTNDVGYYAVKMPMTISNRDFCNQRSWWVSNDSPPSEYIIKNHTVKHPKMPEQKGYVRAHSIITGYMVRRVEDGSQLTYMTQTDPKGWIPGWLVNKVTSSKIPEVMKKLHENAKKYPEWKAQNNPDDKPWLKPPNDPSLYYSDAEGGDDEEGGEKKKKGKKKKSKK